MSGVAGTAVSDRMKYGVKPSAVKTENLLHNIKATTGHNVAVALGNEIIFEIPSMGNGYYCDLGNSYFRFSFAISSTTGNTGLTYDMGRQGLRFERGIESIFRRIQITDASGNLLENLEHYNELYALQEICTAPRIARNGVGFCNGEGFDYTANNVSFNSNAGAAATLIAAFNANVTTTVQYPYGSTVGKYGTSGKYFAEDLGSIVVTGNPAIARRQRVPLKEAAGAAVNTYTYTFQISSSIFGGSSEKYIPMSAINGVRIVMALENVIGSFQSLSILDPIINYTITVKDPTYFLNMIRVDPTVDQQLINSALGPDGMIRIHSQSWTTLSQSVPVNSGTFDYLIPIRVSSLKAIFFGFTRNYQNGDVPASEAFYSGHMCNDATVVGNLAGQANMTAIGFSYLACDENDCQMKAAWFQNNLSSYQFFIDGRPSPATPVIIPRSVAAGYLGGSDMFPSEAVAELARAWHVGHKTFDNVHMSTMFSPMTSDYFRRNFILGHEFESFSSKSSVIESGYNTLNSSIQLRLSFTQLSSYNANLRMYCLYDTFTVIDPQTGIIRTEF
jgi:hypothetical protein